MGKRDLSCNNAQFVSVDLIGENNQVILEYVIKLSEPLVKTDKMLATFRQNVVVILSYIFG